MELEQNRWAAGRVKSERDGTVFALRQPRQGRYDGMRGDSRSDLRLVALYLIEKRADFAGVPMGDAIDR